MHPGTQDTCSVTRVQLWPRVIHVCGLTFSSSPVPGTLVFLPTQNQLPAYSIWLWCCALRSHKKQTPLTNKVKLLIEKVKRSAIGFTCIRVGDWKPLQHPW